jgi:hypothetical protein
MAAFDRIRAKFPDAEMIPVRDAGQFFAQSPDAAAKLAQRGRFPVKPKKVGDRWMVNVEALAAFIDSPGDDADGSDDEPRVGSPPKAESVKSKGKRRALGHDNEKTVRPKSMAEALLAIRRGMEEKRAELDFLLAVFDELELEESRSATGDPPSVPRETL